MNYHSNPKIKYEFKVIVFEDGRLMSTMSDNIATIDKIELIIDLQSQTLKRLNELAEDLLVETGLARKS